MDQYIHGIAVAARGVPVTLLVSLRGSAGRTVLGLLVALAKRSKFKILRGIATIYVDILRGTPAAGTGPDPGLWCAAAGSCDHRDAVQLGTADPGRIYRVRRQQFSLYGGDHPKRTAGGGYRTDGSSQIVRLEQWTDHALCHRAAGL